MRLVWDDSVDDPAPTAVVRVAGMDDADALVAAIAEASDSLDEIDEEIEATNRLAFVFETPAGERLDDDAFFERACEYERVRDRTANFLRTYLAWLDRRFEEYRYGAEHLWRDDLTPTLLWGAFRLAESDSQYVELYADFIESTDLDHEYHQSDHVDALVAQHGWTPEIEYLLTVRATDAIGQHGLEQLETYADFVRENLSTPRHESAMFDALLEYCLLLRDQLRDAESAVEWAERYGEILLDDTEFDAWMRHVHREMSL